VYGEGERHRLDALDSLHLGEEVIAAHFASATPMYCVGRWDRDPSHVHRATVPTSQAVAKIDSHELRWCSAG
jgi:hypothetical protein